MRQSSHKYQKRGVYLIPNAFTTVALFAAFYSVVAALKGEFKTASIAIFFAMLADMFDGRVARLIRCESEFGAEYDSLADMVSFGVAPALVIYSWSLYSIGKAGWIVAFIYTACTALRLARFNTQANALSKKYFQGLPSPAAAAVIASIVWCGSIYEVIGKEVSIIVAAVTILTAGLMVSNIRYYSFKDIDLKGRVPFIAGLFNVFILIAIALNPPFVLLLLALSYTVSGPLMTLLRLNKVRQYHQKEIYRVKS